MVNDDYYRLLKFDIVEKGLKIVLAVLVVATETSIAILVGFNHHHHHVVTRDDDNTIVFFFFFFTLSVIVAGKSSSSG